MLLTFIKFDTSCFAQHRLQTRITAKSRHELSEVDAPRPLHINGMKPTLNFAYVVSRFLLIHTASCTARAANNTAGTADTALGAWSLTKASILQHIHELPLSALH